MSDKDPNGFIVSGRHHGFMVYLRYLQNTVDMGLENSLAFARSGTFDPVCILLLAS
jgi:hypothetical protein